MTGFILLMQSCGSVEVSHGKIRVRQLFKFTFVCDATRITINTHK